jgi:L-rhamnose isomerase
MNHAQAIAWLTHRGHQVLRVDAVADERADLAAILHVVTQHAECVALPIGWEKHPRAVSIHATAKSIGIALLLLPALDSWIPPIGG